MGGGETMNIMKLVAEQYRGTNIKAIKQSGLGRNNNYDLDCNNGGDDCATEDYCES